MTKKITKFLPELRLLSSFINAYLLILSNNRIHNNEVFVRASSQY